MEATDKINTLIDYMENDIKLAKERIKGFEAEKYNGLENQKAISFNKGVISALKTSLLDLKILNR